MQKKLAIPLHDAIKLLDDRKPHDLKLWKKNGEILTYKGAIRVGGSTRKGNTLVQLPRSYVKRLFINIFLFEIDGMSIYL